MKAQMFSLLIVVVVVTAGCSRGTDSTTEAVEVVEELDVSDLNRPLEQNVPTADIVVFHSDNTEATWDELMEGFRTADSVFRSHGVQLNLKKALTVTYPVGWAGMATSESTNEPSGDMELDFYEAMDYEQEFLTERLQSIFGSFLSEENDRERTIYIVPLSDLTISWFERDDNNEWTKVVAPTSAISFPPYLFADRIPKHLRGVISYQRSAAGRKTMAHELGHKLINVSHEGLDVCPRGSGTDVPGLMGYGETVEIFGGRDGRWHQERLLRSPLLYRMVDGEKVWNREYENGGRYDDPIYEGLIMEPACPTG